MVERRNDADFYSSDDISACLRRVTPVQLHETVVIDEDIEITPYYAGHVLGRAVSVLTCLTERTLHCGMGRFGISPPYVRIGFVT